MTASSRVAAISPLSSRGYRAAAPPWFAGYRSKSCPLGSHCQWSLCRLRRRVGIRWTRGVTSQRGAGSQARDAWNLATRFRNPVNAEAFCTIRSYIQTGRKHARDTLTDLVNLQTGTPWLPNTT